MPTKPGKTRASTPASRQAAVLATRRHKPEVEGERFDTSWKAEALDAGWGPDAAEALISTLQPTTEPPLPTRWRLPEWSVGPAGDPIMHDRIVEPEQWIAHLLETELTRPDATFTHPQLIHAIAARLGDGATITTVERIAARVMASPQVVPVNDPAVQRWTSAAHLRRERSILDAAGHSRRTRPGLHQQAINAALLSRPTLGADQAAAVERICSSPDGVTVLVGPAGTGKTFTLDAIRDAFTRSGYQVSGAAPSALGALELSAGAHLPTQTMHRLLGRWSRGVELPDERIVLVIDEAGMAATCDLEPLIRQAIAGGGRVVLVGDHRQLPSVTAGGAFGALASNDDLTVATLEVNRRQRNEWEREALAELRDGHAAEAVDAYRNHHRVVVVDDPAELIDAAVDRYLHARDRGVDPVLYAGTSDTARRLNETVRNRLIARGDLPGAPHLTWGGRKYAVGDRVLLRHNSYQATTVDGGDIALLNGEAGTVTDGGPDGLVVHVDLAKCKTVVPADYIAAGHLDHAYALTTTRTQGGTWDLGIGVGIDGLYREAGYTGLSRGTESNWLVLTRSELDAVDAELRDHNHGIPLPSEQPADVDTDLTQRLERSRAKLLALTRDPHADQVAELAATRPLAALEAEAQRCRAIENEATAMVGCDPRTIADDVARAQHTARHLAVGQRVKAHDRGNIGTIADYDDTAGTITVYFVSPDGNEAEKALPWSAVEIVSPRQPDERELTPEAQITLERLLAPTRAALTAWHAHLADAGITGLDAQHHTRAAELAIDRAANHIQAARPPWLDNLLGPRPEAPVPAVVWDDAVRFIAAHHLRHHDTAINTEAVLARSPDLLAWEDGSVYVARARLWLSTYTSAVSATPERTRSTTELHQRQAELEVILAAAPPDHRDLVAALTAGQLTFDDIDEHLQTVLATQDTRRQWILRHWPHVVEYAEITRTLDTRTAGPQMARLMEDLASLEPDPTTTPLIHAASANERWLRTLLNRLAEPDADQVSPQALPLLIHAAAYRARWSVADAAPLGLAAESDEQALELQSLRDALIEARRQGHDLESAADTLTL